MLPYASHIGISETFGSTTIGNTVFSETENGESISLDFPNEYSEIPKRLTILNSSNRTIWNTKNIESKKFTLTGNSKDESLDNKIIKNNSTWINKNNKTKQLIGDIKTVEETLNEKSLYNPSISQLSKIFKIGTQFYVIFSSGENNNILVLGRIDPQWKGWELIKNKRRLSELQEESKRLTFNDIESRHHNEGHYENENNRIKSPKFIWIKSLTFKLQILGIKTYHLNTDIVLHLVRTRDTIYLLKNMISKSSFSLTKIFEFKQDDNWAFFANSNLLITKNELLLCIIDCVGKFSIFKSMNDKQLSFVQIDLKYQSFYDPAELSNFKNSIWLESNRLILYSRSQLFEYTFTKDSTGKIVDQKFFCRVSAGIWTKLLDIVKSPRDNHLYYMLTTKELIVVDVTKGFSRKLSYKHYLNELDLSMHFNIIKTPRNETNDTCIISSKHSLINYVIEFNTQKIKIVNNPYIFLTDLKEIPINTEIYQFNPKSYLNIILQKQDNGELVFSLLKYTSFYDDKEKYGDLKNFRSNWRTFLKHSFNIPIDKNKAIELYDKLIDYYKFEGKSAPDPNLVTTEIYNKLQIFLDDENIFYKSLFQMINQIHIPRNIKNIFKIVKHLIRNKDDGEFGVRLNKTTWLTDNMKIATLDSTENDVSTDSEEIIKFFESLGGKNDKYITADHTLYLLLSSIQLKKNGKTIDQHDIDKQISKASSKLPDEYLDILDSFENDANIIGIMDSEDEIENSEYNPHKNNFSSIPIVTSSQVPQITVSQQPKSTKIESRKSSPIKKKRFDSNNNTPSLAWSSQQFSQMSQKFSQSNGGFSQSQSKGPKKKKRKTGFL